MRIVALLLLLVACGGGSSEHDAAPGVADAALPDGGTAGEGQACGALDAGTVSCVSGLVCCYPCGIPGCTSVCQAPCTDPGCVDGCPQRP